MESSVSEPERVDVVVVGGAQAGLAIGYHPARRGLRFVILEAHARVGDSWRTRWDSLRLFTPARYDALPGLRFPGPPYTFPTKDEMADYVERYAATFGLPVATGVRVDGLRRAAEDDGYVVTAGHLRWLAPRVVLATGAYAEPRIPGFARELDPQILQLHSSAQGSRRHLGAHGDPVAHAADPIDLRLHDVAMAEAARRRHELPATPSRAGEHEIARIQREAARAVREDLGTEKPCSPWSRPGPSPRSPGCAGRAAWRVVDLIRVTTHGPTWQNVSRLLPRVH
jgi:glycine/D-amino acid oxidase-like deaminating enzyme